MNNGNTTENTLSFLEKSTKLADELVQQKRTELAREVLKTALMMTMVLTRIERLGIKNRDCPICHREQKGEDEILFLQNIGMCFHCDHLQADV